MFLCSDPAPSHIHTLSLHDALPISGVMAATNQELSAAGANIESQVLATSGSLGYAVTDISGEVPAETLARIEAMEATVRLRTLRPEDRKSTRLNSSHVAISYAGFCLKNKHPLGGG